ncbi:adipolin-like isoform X2 [Denticeps clupeoides]|uniref:adipolin-like isoform X2 n=1 Tax=Denticeps clupeoides TaxID=299321 RepID=UPI0010A353ED|nr:adipolin-like isoform X2 [Denticeps clupeoides]
MRTWLLVLLATLGGSVLGVQCLLMEDEVVQGKRRHKDAKTQFTELHNRTLSKTEEKGSRKEIHTVDPHGSWRDFVNRPNENVLRKCRGKKRVLSGPPGPQGPPGPHGPPGAPGAEVTHELLLQEFRQMAQDATQRREATLNRLTNSTPSSALLALGDMTTVPRFVAAFHCRLRTPLILGRKSMKEMKSFESTAAKGAFVRGTGLNPSTGRFTAPVTGIYQFSTNIHISWDHVEVKRDRGQQRSRDHVRLLICIESLCDRQNSLEMVVSLESQSLNFTASIHGILELKAGQYISLFLHNGATHPITAQAGSAFMGLFLGL